MSATKQCRGCIAQIPASDPDRCERCDTNTDTVTVAQVVALIDLCRRYHVTYDPRHYLPTAECGPGWIQGWLGGHEHMTIFVGVSPEGQVHS